MVTAEIGEVVENVVRNTARRADDSGRASVGTRYRSDPGGVVQPGRPLADQQRVALAVNDVGEANPTVLKKSPTAQAWVAFDGADAEDAGVV